MNYLPRAKTQTYASITMPYYLTPRARKSSAGSKRSRIFFDRSALTWLGGCCRIGSPLCWVRGALRRRGASGLVSGGFMSKIDGSGEPTSRKVKGDVAAISARIIANVEKVVLGKRPQI